MFKKRFFAFIIDLIIVFLITFVIDMIIPISDNAQKLSEELFDLNNNFIDGNIGIDMFINQYSIINYGLEKELSFKVKEILEKHVYLLKVCHFDDISCGSRHNVGTFKVSEKQGSLVVGRV